MTASIQVALWPELAPAPASRSSSLVRVRAFRARERAKRSASWRQELGADLAAILSAWSAIGLRWPPTERQAQLLRESAPTMALRSEAGALLRRLPRARSSRAHSAVYNLVRSLLDGIAVLRAASHDREAPRPSAPEGQAPAPARQGPVPMARTPDPGGGGSGPPGGLLGLLRRAGLRDDLADEWGCDHGLVDDRP